jgi:MYXO-CTERM domain-containing protein
MPLSVPQGRWTRTTVALTTLAAHASTWAHEGHGMEGGHWHATDSWGLLAAAVLAALVFYRRK